MTIPTPAPSHTNHSGIQASMYSVALEHQLELARWWRSPRGSAAAEEILRQAASSGENPLRLLHSAYVRMLEQGDTYFVSSDVAGAVMAAADGLPSTPLAKSDVPSDTGWAWLETPLPIGCDDRLLIQAIAWSWGVSLQDDGSELEGLTVVSYCAYDGVGLYPASVLFWRNRDAWDSWLSRRLEARDGTVLAALRRFLHALFLFMQQRILIAPQQPAERHVRKRLERDGWQREPLIRVVQLRRSDYTSTKSNGVTHPVDWSCRWITSGHWRQQACGPGRSERRPTFIASYVKGPENRPLKAPRATVFAVTR